MILYQPLIVPTRMAAVLRLLRQAGPMTRAQLEDLMQPPSLRSSEQAAPMVRHNLEACKRLGLVTEDEPHGVADVVPPGVPDYADCLRLFARRIIGRDMPAVDHAAPHEFYQFARIAAWYLDQSAARLPLRLADVQERWADIGETGFRSINNPGWPQWLHWAQALGLAVEIDLSGPKSFGKAAQEEGGRVLVVNPADFLRRHLDELLPAGATTAASVWLRQLGESFPVFETGWIRRRVRDTDDRILSDSLSLALLRLRDLGVATLEDRKDAERYRLRLGRYDETFTHLARQGGRSG
jgi:hypothetical protein